MVSVLLLEAGGDDDVPIVSEANRWFENFGTERDWKFVAQPNPHLNGRAMPLPMGRVLENAGSVNGLLFVTELQSEMMPLTTGLKCGSLFCGSLSDFRTRQM